MCVKFKDEYLEVDGKRCLYSDILKCSIQNEDAHFKGNTKPFTHTIRISFVDTSNPRKGRLKAIKKRPHAKIRFVF